MVGECRQIDDFNAQSCGFAVEALRVFGRGEIVVEGVGVRHVQFRGDHGFHRFDGAVDAVLDGCDDVEGVHEVDISEGLFFVCSRQCALQTEHLFCCRDEA